MAKVRAGRLDTFVTFQQQGKIKSEGSGAEKLVWLNLFDAWAEKQTVSERTRLAADAVGAVRSFALVMDLDERVDSTMRVNIHDKFYKVESIQLDGQAMTVLCGDEVSACQRIL